LPPVSQKKSRILSSNEVECFLAIANETEDRYAALFYVAFFCGLRIGELLALQWRYLDFDKREIHVRAQLQRLKGMGLVTLNPKRDEQRTVPFGARVALALQSHLERQDVDRINAGPVYENQGLVFATIKGTPVDPQNIANRHFKPILDKANLPKITFHSSRHSCATTLLSRHVDVGTVSEILGHRDVATTLRFYGHVLPRMKHYAATIFDEMS